MIIITGQTATGKTKLALKYAIKYNGELINFDSRQIYKYLDIITGKDLSINSKFKVKSANWMIKSKLKNKNYSIGYYQISTNSTDLTDSTDSNRFQPIPTDFNRFQQISTDLTDSTKLWLYDIVEPNQYFSSFEWTKLAKIVIEDITKRGKTPILVGGTYFYLKHFLYGFDYQIPPDFNLRKQLNEKSVENLQKILLSLNPKINQSMNQSDWYNPRRLIRKIEIEKSNLKKEVKNSNYKKKLFPSTKIIGLYYKDKNKLKQAIINRVEERIKKGAFEEVKKILKLGFKKTDAGLKTIGYQQIIEYLEGKVSKKEAINKWIIAEIQYAKRQFTFMKKDKNIEWINVDNNL